MIEFKPKIEGEADYSRLLTTFIKTCRQSAGAGGGHSAGGFGMGAMVPVTNHAAGGAKGGGGKGYAPDWTCPACGDLQFARNTACRKCGTPKPAASAGQNHSAAGRGGGASQFQNFGGGAASQFQSFAGANAGAGAGPAPDLQSFRLQFPMDDRAFDFLSGQAVELQRKVVEGFRPRQMGDADYSGAITSYVRFCSRGPPGAGGFAAAGGGAATQNHALQNPNNRVAIERFRQQFPMDERAFDFLSSSDPDVQQAVLTGFRPKQYGDPDYSGAVTSFVKMCRGGPPAAKRPRFGAPGAAPAF